ncbi:Transcriptional regulator, contains XRE-family HTH domain [Micromonospora nigra]|uniref:Transcriptional regulator, contains XRE-family HTH domain n=1 Tax=Micromonospora nigra TaxID=145857 RepID=A0A1C6RYS5_9ACTN|nr:helix-turn-helix domain-containing protein [Micromonospora nigra]SCL22193.1 Transcriptional regulator, contains XRE-family HTH domain [Micromonospora nigra]
MDNREQVPIGRQVAYWRTRRRLSQQVFADRLGKSKSWVDKVERGVRSLDKMSTLRHIATVLRIDTAVLFGRDVQPVVVADRVEGVERIREALSTYDSALGRPAVRSVALPADRLTREVGHAWTMFQHARYPQVAALVPGLLAGVQRVHADDPGWGRPLLVEVYRLTAALLTKLGEVDLGWLAADRAMAAATGHPELVAAAAVQLGQVLRASGRARAALSTTLAAAYRIAPPNPDDDGSPAAWSLCGTLLVQAALAAASRGDEHAAAELLDEAAGMAARVGDGHDHHRTAFGPAAVDLARAAAALDLGDASEAVTWHEKTTTRDAWRWLPLEHRAAHLIDAARAYAEVGDPISAARVLVDADRMAPAEVRHRPAAREVLAQVAGDPHAPATIIQLAAALGVTCQ